LDGPLPKGCTVILISNQDGHQAKNRKIMGMKLKKILLLPVAAILVGGLKCWTQFWKKTTQEPFQQSLVEIGSVVSE
jgi:hypothetical protein